MPITSFLSAKHRFVTSRLISNSNVKKEKKNKSGDDSDIDGCPLENPLVNPLHPLYPNGVANTPGPQVDSESDWDIGDDFSATSRISKRQ